MFVLMEFFLNTGLFVSYVIAMIFFLKKSNLSAYTGLTKNNIIILYLIFVASSLCYVYSHLHFISSGDIQMYFKDGLTIAKQLPEKPLLYLRLVFGPIDKNLDPYGFDPYEDLWFWMSTSGHLMVRINAVFALISNQCIYIHGLLMSSTAFLGMCMYAAFLKTYLQLNTKWIIALFIFPSILFWGCGMHKEMVVILGLGSFCYGLCKWRYQSSYLLTAFLLIVGLLLLFSIRNYFFLIVVPLILLGVVPKSRVGLNLIFCSAFLLCLLFFSIYPIPILGETVSEIILEKRIAFMETNHGSNSFQLPSSGNGMLSHIIFLMKSIALVFVGPLMFETSWLVKLSLIETMFIVLLMLSAVRSKTSINSLQVNFLIIAGLLSLVIGLTVPNWGAIFRYKMMVYLFLLPNLSSLLKKA